MATVVMKSSVALNELYAFLERELTKFQNPLFLRIADELPATATAKLTKHQFQSEGFNPVAVHDELYFRSADGYVSLTPALYADIQSGKVPL